MIMNMTDRVSSFSIFPNTYEYDAFCIDASAGDVTATLETGYLTAGNYGFLILFVRKDESLNQVRIDACNGKIIHAHMLSYDNMPNHDRDVFLWGQWSHIWLLGIGNGNWVVVGDNDDPEVVIQDSYDSDE